MLRISYLGQTTFRLDSGENSLLLNPGIWEGEPLVPDDHDIRLIAVTNHDDDALGNATQIAANSKSWILGNKTTIDKVSEQGGKPWLLHVLKSEEPYEIPGLKISPHSLKKGAMGADRIENLGLLIEMGKMRIAYLGDANTRGPFGQLEAEILITPVGGGDIFEVKDATSLCVDMKPRIVIPMRWTAPEQREKFTKYIDQFGGGTEVVLMNPGQVIETQWAAGNEFQYTLD